jgi:mannan endo-1,4-beta-mannosidase
MGQIAYFGHQSSTLEGVGWANGNGVSDIQKVSGHLPAVYGWELAEFKLSGERIKTLLAAHVRAAYDRGGINTFSWHLRNPVTGKNAWDTTRAIREILPGGALHDAYKNQLDAIAEFTRHLVDRRGRPIPVIFRPFHEQDGHWFWWGAPHTTKQDYIDLFRFTVRYLRDVKNVHQFLYAYSPAQFLTPFDYLSSYPGDDVVDVLGHDNYSDTLPIGLSWMLTWRTAVLAEMAVSRGKIAALTELGAENVPDPNYWTERVLKPLVSTPFSKKIAYLLFWRNESEKHFFAPYPGHSSTADFVRFVSDPWIKMDGDPSLYVLPPSANDR